MAQQGEFFARKDRLHVGADGVVIVNAAELAGAAGRALISVVNHPHQVFLFHDGVFANQLARHAAVLRQHQQPGRVNVKAPGGHQAFELAGVEEKTGVVLRPAVLRLHQGDGGQMAVFSLAADEADRLVHQHRHLLGLLALGLLVDLNAHIGLHLHAHGRHRPVDLDPALGNPVIGFAA